MLEYSETSIVAEIELLEAEGIIGPLTRGAPAARGSSFQDSGGAERAPVAGHPTPPAGRGMPS
jgi:hypothetical protein